MGADRILDLDADRAAAPPRKVRLGGKEYTLAPRTFRAVRTFRAASKAADKAQDDDAMEAAILAILQAVLPGADASALDHLDPEGGTLKRILAFWAGEDDEEAAEVAADPTSPG